MKSIYGTLATAVLLLGGCKDTPKEQSFFQYHLTVLKDRIPVREISLEKHQEDTINLAECVIKDSIVITPSRGDYLFEVCSLSSGSEPLFLCRKGRAANELVSSAPLSEIIERGGDRCAYLYSVSENKCFLWNIDKSLGAGEDVFDRYIRFDSDIAPVLMSIWWLDEDSILAFDSSQNPYKTSELNAPRYVKYSVSDGKQIGEYDLFNSMDVPVSSAIPAAVLLSSVDCIRPDRKKVAFAMSYMPILSILDIDSGEAEGYMLPDTHHLELDVLRWHFADIAADEDYIFALYSGNELYNGNGTDIPDIMYVFDWNGKALQKIRLGNRFTNIQLDRDILYFTSPDNSIACMKVADMLQDY